MADLSRGVIKRGHLVMSDIKDILLFRQVLEEMGIPIQEGQGGITINGIPAVQYLEEHDIFAVPEEV